MILTTPTFGILGSILVHAILLALKYDKKYSDFVRNLVSMVQLCLFLALDYPVGKVEY